MNHLYKAYNFYKEGGISCEKICEDIGKLISSVSHDPNNQWILMVTIKKINEYTGDNPLPKITCEDTTVSPKSTDLAP